MIFRRPFSRWVLWPTGMVMLVAPLLAQEPVKPVSTEPVVVMRPFSVVAEWLEIQPLIQNGVIESVRITHVRPSSPAAAAGIKAGMRMVELQGINVVGLKEEAFIEKLQALPPSHQLSLKVRSVTMPTVVAFEVPIGVRAGVAPARIAPLGPVAGGAPVSATTVRAQLAAARRAADAEETRMDRELRESMGRMVRISPYLQGQIADELAPAVAEHLGLLCEAAIKAEGGIGARVLRSALLDAITRPRDYSLEQKKIILQSLPKLPELIATLKRMNWLEGAEAEIAAGWKIARDDERDGVLNPRGSLYASLAARHGVRDALVALARTVREPDAARRFSDGGSSARLLAEEMATLKAVVPLENADGLAIAQYVLKHKSRLVFDATRKVYVLKE